MKLEKSKLFKRIMAYVLVICIMFSMEPTVFADSETTAAIPDLLEPVNLGPAITTSASPTEWALRSTVDGKDYLFTPLRGSQLVVYDLDAYMEDPTNDAAVNVDVEETGINVPRGIVECNGYIYVCGEGGGFLYKYNPVTKDGEKIVIQTMLGSDFQYMDLRDITKDDAGNLYIAADRHGIIKYDTVNNTAEVLYDIDTQLYFTILYDNGYVYCGINGAIIKVNVSTKEQVAIGDYSTISTGRLFYMSVVDGIVFGGGASGAKKMVAFDADTMQPVNVGIDGHIMGIVTPERDGKHYFVVDGVGLCEYDPSTNQATKYMDFNKYLTCRDALIEVDGRDCIITCNSGFNVRVLDLETKETTTLEDLTDNVNSKIELRSVASGVPGSDLIWIGGYQNNNVSSYNTETQKFSNKVFSSGYAQTDTILTYNGKLYMGAYYGAYLVEYDPVTKVVRQLSGEMGTTFNQNRMHALAAGDNKIFFSTIPDSSFGSIIGWYDLTDDTLYVASGLGKLNDGTYEEKLFHAKRDDLVRSDYLSTEDKIWTDEDDNTYTPSELRALALADKAYNFVPGTEGYTDPKVDVPYGLKGIVYYQEVINLAYHEGYLYCTTSCAGGIGYNQGDARKQEEAMLMVYDVNNGQKADEFFVRAGSENVVGGIEGLTTPYYIAGVAAGNGKLWGQVSGTLFSFDYDAANGKLTVEEELSFGKTEYPIAGTRHLCPTPILFDDQGYMYVSFSGRGICQINCNDPSDNRRLTRSDTLGYALGEDGNLYYIHGYDFYKVALTDVAKVEQLINAIGTVTLESSEAITAARTAYNALSVEDKAVVNNYLTLQNAEIAFDTLSSVHTAEVTVKYDFFNTIVATGAADAYGYSKAPMSAAGNQTAWNDAYSAGTINNVYAGHYAGTDTSAVPNITDYNSNGSTWKGIMYWSFKEDWVALKIKSPGDGEFNMSLDYYQNPNNVTEASVYILPGDTTNISEALDTAIAQAKVNLYVGSGHQTVSIGKAEFKEADEDYIIVFKCTDSRHGDNTARMYLTGLKMSAYFETLEEAQEMAGNSPFHSAKLLYDEEANKVKTQIEAIGTVTRNSETAIEAARAAYEALNEDQKALVTNLQTLVEAEAKLEELKLSDIDRAEVTVKYDFFNTLVSTGAADAYGYAKLNLTPTAGNYVNTWKPAYSAGTINNVYAGHYSSASGNYPGITSLYNKAGDNLWNGIYYAALTGDWVALKINSPGDGKFDMSLDYYRNNNNATEASIYILPGDTEDISDALNTAVAQAKVNLYTGSENYLNMAIGEATFEAGKDYILVFKSTGSRHSDGTARMHLTGLTMTTQLPTLEDALEMAGDSSFHTVKLLSDEAAEAVVSSIATIGEVTLASEEAIEAARAAYTALNEYQQALVTNLQTLVEAEAKLEELKLSDIDRAEVTVKYDFYNTLVSTGTPDTYGYAKLNLTPTAGNYVNKWLPAYGAGTINNVYAGNYTSASANYPGITSLYKSGDNVWNGIYYAALTGDWIALKIKSPGEGDFNMSLDYYQNGNNATEASIYILPGNTENISTALDSAVAQAKVNLYKGSGHQTVSIEEATFEAGKEYILVFKSTGSRFSDGTARMHLTGLTMTTQLPTLEDALKMAGDSSFHTVKLLSDEAAEAVVSSIAAIGEVTLASEDKITAARAAYAALNEYQQALVTNLQTLVDAEVALAELKSNITGYIAEISVAGNVVNKGEQVSVNVSVNHQAAEGQVPETGFNAGEITVSYDSTKLTFNEQASTLGDATVNIISDGILKLADYGEDKNFATNVYVLVFDAKETGEAPVELTAAAFINKADAVSSDLVAATLGQTEVAVTIKAAHAVTLPEGFTGNSIVEDGEDYTFEAVDKNYEYTFTATVGGQTATVTDNGDGTYTVASVNGDLVISVADKNGKSYGVTFEGTGKDDMTGAATATYGTDYTFTLPTVEGSLYDVDGITIGGTAYTGYSVSEKTYTIPGSAITGNVVITVTKESAPVTNVTVTVEGNGAGAAAGFVNTAVKNQAYTLTIAPESGYSYQVSATMGGVAVANMTVDGNAYTIPNVTGDIVFAITASVITDGVSVSEYLTLDGTKMWLVKNTTELANGKVSTYGDASMFWSEEYDAYCYLVVADDLQTDAAKALVGIKEGTAVTVDYGMDVNITGKVDASDAQLVYNMYNAAYDNFDDRVTMEKFLRADVTADQKIDVNDAAAIIAFVLGSASN